MKYHKAFALIVLGMSLALATCTPKRENISAEARDTLVCHAENKINESDTAMDIDGNVYHTITLGTQIWMVENLKVTRYRNGNPIVNYVDDDRWSKLTTSPAYCNYNNDTTLANTYGRLYNWYAVHDPRRIAPKNWHIPTLAEWETLIHYLGGNNVGGGKLKESQIIHWDSPNSGATNSTGFTALPGGERNNNGTYTNLGFSGGWWTATGSDGDFASMTSMLSTSKNITTDIDDMRYGYSIRCVRDKIAFQP